MVAAGGASPLLVAAAAMVGRDGRLLVQQRPAGKPMAELWEFPGGKVEPGETPEAALVRELAEELAVDVAPDAPVPACFASAPLGERRLVLLLYLVRDWRGAPRSLEDAALRWVALEELGTLPMPPADRPLVEMLGRLL